MIIIKTEKQIDGIRQSSRLAAATLRFIGSHIAPGISTEKLDILAEEYIRDAGAIPAPLGYRGFPKSICTSINEVICHGIPSNETFLKEGDIINVDVTTILNSYYGDVSQMFCVGQISGQAQKLVAVTKECLDIGIKQVRPDNCFGEIGRAITKHAHKNKFSVVYQFSGHGVGIEFHEDPFISHDTMGKYNHTKMKPGMIFTIEPMICENSPKAKLLSDRWTAVTEDGGLSAQFEHTILVTSSGFEILTV